MWGKGRQADLSASPCARLAASAAKGGASPPSLQTGCTNAHDHSCYLLWPLTAAPSIPSILGWSPTGSWGISFLAKNLIPMKVSTVFTLPFNNMATISCIRLIFLLPWLGKYTLLHSKLPKSGLSNLPSPLWQWFKKYSNILLPALLSAIAEFVPFFNIHYTMSTS